MSSEGLGAPPARAGGAEALAVVVTAGVTPYLRRTLRALARQTVAPEATIVVDVASRHNGLGDGTPVEEIVAASALGARTRVRVVRVPDARGFGEAVRRGLALYAELTGPAGSSSRRLSPSSGKRRDAARSNRPKRSYDEAGSKSRASGRTGGQNGQNMGAEGWLWLLHDDVAPAPGCLEALLSAVAEARSAALVGPKQVDWDDPEQLLEVGLRTTASARRSNDVVAGEIDQGQHDDRSDVLAVGTAGALVDRAVWEELDGTSPEFPVFNDGLELSRAIRLAGHRVVVVPQAVIQHRRASYLGLRPSQRSASRRSAVGEQPSAPQVHADDPDPDRSFRARRTAQLTAWATFSHRPIALLLIWFLVLGIVRAGARLLTKSPPLARAELGAALAVASRGGAVRRGRKRLAAHATVRRSVLTRLYVDASDIRSVRRDRLRQERERVARAAAPSELELRELAALARRRRIVLAGVLLVAVVVAGVGLSSLLVTGTVTGGATVGLTATGRSLWSAAWATWAASSDGYTAVANPLLALLALPVAVAGHVGLDGDGLVRLLFLAAVPLAALGAWFAAGTATRRTSLRAWAALTWALAPALLLAIGQGRLTAVLVHLTLPWALTALARAVGADRRDVVLSGMVDAHHATETEKADLDRFASERIEDLAALADDDGDGAGGAGGAGDTGDAAAVDGVDADQAAEGGNGSEPASDTRADGDSRGSTNSDDSDDSDDSGEPGDEASNAAAVPRERAIALARIVEDNDAEFGAAASQDDEVDEQASEAADSSSVTPGDESHGSGDSNDDDGDGDSTAWATGTTGATGPLGSVGSSVGDGRGAAGTAATAATESYGPGSPTAAAVAGIFLTLIVAAAPSTAAVVVGCLLVLMVMLRRSALRLVLTLLPVVATAAPAWWRAARLASAEGPTAGLRYLLADAGGPVAVPAPSAIDTLLGMPVDITALIANPTLVLVSKAMLAILPVTALCGLLATGRRGHRARAGALGALGGLGLALLAVRATTAIGTLPDGTGSVTVTGWAGTGITLLTAGLLAAGLAGADGIRAGLVRHDTHEAVWRRFVLTAVTLVGLVVPLAVGAGWAWTAHTSTGLGADATVMALQPGVQRVPVIAKEIQRSASAGRVLALSSTPEGLAVRTWRGAGTQLTDVVPDVLAPQLRSRLPEAAGDADPSAATSPAPAGKTLSLEPTDPADVELADIVTRATAGQDEHAADDLAAHGIAVVLLADAPGDEATALARAGLESTPGLDQLTRTAAGTSWRVGPSGATEAARATLVDADGTATTLATSADAGTVVTADVPAATDGQSRTVVLAERADAGWSAKLNDSPLDPIDVQDATGSWRQAFSMPPGGGELVVSHQSTAGTVAARLIWAAWAITVLAALPLRRRRTIA